MVRLVGGPVEYMGRVEVYDRESDQWGTVCYNDVIDQYVSAQLVCNSIFGTYTLLMVQQICLLTYNHQLTIQL